MSKILVMCLRPRDEYLIQECHYLSVEQKNALIEDGIVTFLQFLNQPCDYIMEITKMNYLEYDDLKRAIVLQCRPPCPSLLEKLIKYPKLVPTGITRFDDFFDGGLYGGEILEICGKSGTGKTQMCMSIAAEICYRQDKRVKGEKSIGPTVVYIDLKRDFAPLRFLELCEDSDGSLDRVHVFPENKVQDVINIIESFEQEMCIGQTSFMANIGAMILDSMPVALYPCMNDDDDSGRIYQERLVQALTRLAGRFNVVIIMTNHTVLDRTKKVRRRRHRQTSTEEVVETQEEQVERKLIPALGKYWHGVPNFRLFLSQDDNPRIFQATLGKSTRTSTDLTFKFEISKKGIECVTEDDSQMSD